MEGQEGATSSAEGQEGATSIVEGQEGATSTAEGREGATSTVEGQEGATSTTEGQEGATSNYPPTTILPPLPHYPPTPRHRLILSPSAVTSLPRGLSVDIAEVYTCTVSAQRIIIMRKSILDISFILYIVIV